MRIPINKDINESLPFPSLKTIIRGIQAFIIISLLSCIFAFWWKTPIGFESLLQKLKWSYAVILIPLVGMDYLLGGMRYRLFFNGRALTRVSLWNCMRSNWANIFLGTTTPFQTGGGAAQLYILWRCGAKISEGMLTSLINFANTLIFFLIASITSLLLLPFHLFGSDLTPILKAGYVVLLIVLVMVLTGLFSPNTVLIILRNFFRFIPIRRQKFLHLRDRLLTTIELGIHRFHESFMRILRLMKGSLVIAFILTTALFFNKFIIGYFITCLLGEKVPFDIFIALQIIQLFLIYFAPTPGASGMAELTSTWLIAYILPSGLILVYTVIWRFLTTILGAIIGGFILFLDLRHLNKEKLSKNWSPTIKD